MWGTFFSFWKYKRRRNFNSWDRVSIQYRFYFCFSIKSWLKLYLSLLVLKIDLMCIHLFLIRLSLSKIWTKVERGDHGERYKSRNKYNNICNKIRMYYVNYMLDRLVFKIHGDIRRDRGKVDFRPFVKFIWEILRFNFFKM